ncbi:MAG: hypothetical protein KatS3mg050_1652 [Litorilinea sp.]|nr:MAG: hypothetical protein KatS3mg050_1652 [Litorilinea sp.]
MALQTLQDEIRYCERCGISFLWEVEAQKRQQGEPAPTLCPGCRRLLPPPGWERGVVKWYNRRRRYGFIVRPGQPDVFVHGSHLEESRHLRPGDLVEFQVVMGDQGPMATSCRVLAHYPDWDE